MAAKKAKAKRTRKPKAAPSKDHFKAGQEDRIRIKLGDIKGTQVEIEAVRGDETIRLVGDKYEQYTGYQGRRTERTEDGVTVPVYVDEKGVYIAPECGDYGLALTKETLASLAKAVAEYKPKAA